MVDCHVCAIIVHWVSSPTISTTLLTLKANNVDCVCHHSRRLYSSANVTLSSSSLSSTVVVVINCRCRHRRRHHCCSLNSFVGGAMIHALTIMLRYPSCQYPPLRCRFQVDGGPRSSPSHWTTTGRWWIRRRSIIMIAHRFANSTMEAFTPCDAESSLLFK